MGMICITNHLGCVEDSPPFQGAVMDIRPDYKSLIRRQIEIQNAMRRPGGIRITVERELLAIREQLRQLLPAGASSFHGDAHK
jgi:hypothetical protein